MAQKLTLILRIILFLGLIIFLSRDIIYNEASFFKGQTLYLFLAGLAFLIFGAVYTKIAQKD